MKVLFIDPPHPHLGNQLESMGFECITDSQSSEELIAESIHQFTGIVIRSRIPIGKSLFDKATKLKFIAREGVGLEHIDVEYAKIKGIDVLTSPEGSRDSVGEHATGLLLCLLNKINLADAQVRRGVWERASNRGTELKGKTVGILGYGNMGSSFARKLSGFDCEVLSYDRYKTEYADEYVKEVSLKTLQEQSDIISLHFPYSRENHYFIDRAFVGEMKKDFYLINTARGLVLNTADLVQQLKTGKIKGAALDVLEYEESSFDKFKLDKLPDDFNYLASADNVVLTPHIAGWSWESKKRHAQVLGEKIRNLFLG